MTAEEILSKALETKEAADHMIKDTKSKQIKVVYLPSVDSILVMQLDNPNWKPF